MKVTMQVASIPLFMIVCAGGTEAQYSRQDREEMKRMVRGDLYLRNNVPLRLGRRGVFTGRRDIATDVITEVAPTGVDWGKNLTALQQGGEDHFYWGFGPNDIIRYGELSFKKDVIVLWAEGVKPKNQAIGIGFVQIKNLDDFKKAFDWILSHRPLQDEHPEWPEEIRRAIASRKVIEGMTKAQAFIVLGSPIRVEEGEKDGKKTETWFPRQEIGTPAGWGSVSPTTGFPASVQFADGKVTMVKESGPTDIKKVLIP